MHVAQLDRALGYGPRCREFESSHARVYKELLNSFNNSFFDFTVDIHKESDIMKENKVYFIVGGIV